LDGGGLGALLSALSASHLAEIAAAALSGEGDTSPLVLREGGVLTDTMGDIHVSYLFYDHSPQDWLHADVLAEDYEFDEFEEVRETSADAAIEAGGPGGAVLPLSGSVSLGVAHGHPGGNRPSGPLPCPSRQR